MKNKYLFIIAVVCMLLVLIKSTWDDNTIEEYWKSKLKITNLEIGKFPIKIETLEWYEGVRIVNSEYYSMLPYCNANLKPKCFDDFLSVGDYLFYINKEDAIKIERADSIFVFTKY